MAIITLTEHEIILAQREQMTILADVLRLAAATTDEFVDSLSAEDARHSLKTFSALAKAALGKARLDSPVAA